MRGCTITAKLGKWHQVGLKFTDFLGRGSRLVGGFLSGITGIVIRLVPCRVRVNGESPKANTM